MTHDEFRSFILQHHWIFAKTYAAFCPHEYLVKERLPKTEHEVFTEVARLILQDGFTASYGRLGPNQYYIVDDWYYWIMDKSAADATLINRARLCDYDFIGTAQGMTVHRHRGWP